MKNKSYLLGFIFFILLFSYSFSKAQVYLTNDTMKVGGGTYANDIIYVNPGDTRVPVIVYLRNTFDVAGFTLRMVYDSTIMYPRPPVPDSSFYQPIRSQSLPIFGGNFDVPGEIYFTGSPFLPVITTIAAGRGPIVEFYFNIKSTAQPGYYPIKLEEDTLNYPDFDNTLGDPMGQNMYIPVLANGAICVGTCAPPTNNPPVVSPVSPKSVVVGETLSFSVSATDPDNDLITLFAQNRPTNSTFPQVQGTGSVTGTFTFIPAPEQAPDTLSVTFIVRDIYNSADTINVTIFLYEEIIPPQEPTDKLKILSTEGGVPGSKGKLIPVYFINDLDTVYGVEFSLNYNPQAVIIDSLVLAQRVNGFSVYSNRGDTLGKLTVLLFGLGNEKILPGAGDILYLALSVDTLAPFGDSPLDLTSAWEAISVNPNVPSRALAMVDGVFAVDMFGDINLDKIVNVSDVVSLVAYILGSISLDTRHYEAANINRDADVNVGDLVGVINTILHRPINAPIVNYREPLASLRLEYDSLQAGSPGSINLWADLKTSIAGVQFKIEYDPQQLSFSHPQLTSRSSSFDTVYYKDDGKGNLTILSFSFGKNPIGVGQGNILTLPVVVKSDFDKEKLRLSLKEAILADPTAVVIPVDKGEVVLPKSFSLGQNYPNPFNPTTTIRFEIGIGGGPQQSVQTTLRVYNILGQRVKTLVDEPKSSGIYYQTWDGKDEQGDKVSSGVYFYQLRAGGYNQTKKMVLLK
ncbi:MAG: cohesin domain-containing protein [candidate division Zixibacteria bacterium]|nr:cohesin domain-containing protein [candidate division Zixibacteria bacterium]